nr:hypothetical protein [Tanacetum cinerariifolium]
PGQPVPQKITARKGKGEKTIGEALLRAPAMPRILTIDDEKAIRFALKDILELEGYQ